jgi:hypothetical protein
VAFDKQARGEIYKVDCTLNIGEKTMIMCNNGDIESWNVLKIDKSRGIVYVHKIEGVDEKRKVVSIEMLKKWRFFSPEK